MGPVDAPIGAFATGVRAFRGEAGLRHLVGVLAGLDSRVFGEQQILGQVRASVDAAHESGTLCDPLTWLFRSALRAGRRVRAESGIERVASSYARLAGRRAASAGDRIGIVGTGATAALVGAALRGRGIGRVEVFGRHEGRTRAVAADVGGVAVPLDEMRSRLGRLSAVVSAVSSARPVICSADVAGAPGTLFIDLGVPPNVERAGSPRDRVVGLEELASGLSPHRAVRAAAERVLEAECDRLLGAVSGVGRVRPWLPRKRARSERAFGVAS